jgi:hypothetical protein
MALKRHELRTVLAGARPCSPLPRGDGAETDLSLSGYVCIF